MCVPLHAARNGRWRVISSQRGRSGVKATAHSLKPAHTISAVPQKATYEDATGAALVADANLEAKHANLGGAVPAGSKKKGQGDCSGQN